MDSATTPVQQDETTPKAARTTLTVPMAVENGDRDAYMAGLMEANEVNENTFMSMGMSYLSSGSRDLEAARNSGNELRKEYKKTARRHAVTKYMALGAESLLMAYYGYGAIEHYTGMKEGTKAVAINSAVSTGISVTRAGVQYGLMKRGEECFREGDKTRGAVFVGIGLGLALINSLFVAVGFAHKYVTQEQGVASAELDKLSAAETKVHAEKTAAVAQINSEIDALDKRLSAVRSGSGDPRLAAIEQQMKRLADEVDGIRNHANFNDGKDTEWDKAARRDMTSKEGLMQSLAQQKEKILLEAGTNLTPEQQRMLEASTKQRLALNEQIENLDKRFKPQFDALAASRKLFEARLGGVADSGNSFKALGNNPTILIEALANVAAISVANWWAAQEGYKQETVQKILAGAAADDPWEKKKNKQEAQAEGAEKEVTAVPAKKGFPRVFMGYDCAAPAIDHMHNQQQIEALTKAVGNPDAMRVEMKSEVTRQYGKMVGMLNVARDQLGAEDYTQRLDKLTKAYQGVLVMLKDDEVLVEIAKVMAAAPEMLEEKKPVSKKGPKIPEFSDPDDPKFKALPSGSQFKTKDGQVRVKL